MTEITTELDYQSASTPEDCVFKISPSSFSYFVDRPHLWYEQQVLGENVFDYNTSSVLGTIVHYVAECIASDKDVNTDEIEAYYNKFEPKEDYDPEEVKKQWYPMSHALVNQFILQSTSNIFEAENQVCASLGDGFYVAGTYDILEGSKEDCCISDYKTYNSKTKPRSISTGYRYQLLVYAWCLRQNGYNVTRGRNIYVNRNIDGGISEKTGKPLKSYPPEATVHTEVFTEEDFDFIESLLYLCKDTLIASNDHPELRHVIWHDPRLKTDAV